MLKLYHFPIITTPITFLFPFAEVAKYRDWFFIYLHGIDDRQLVLFCKNLLLSLYFGIFFLCFLNDEISYKIKAELQG